MPPRKISSGPLSGASSRWIPRPTTTDSGELLDARDEALKAGSSNLPTAVGDNALLLAREQSLASVRHQDAVAAFDRSTSALVSARTTALVRLRTMAAILSVVAAAVAALSYERLNPYLETFLRSGIEAEQLALEAALQEALEELELELTLRNTAYNELASRLDGLVGSRRVRALAHLATRTNSVHLVYGGNWGGSLPIPTTQDDTAYQTALSFFQLICGPLQGKESSGPLAWWWFEPPASCEHWSDSLGGFDRAHLLLPMSTLLLDVQARYLNENWPIPFGQVADRLPRARTAFGEAIRELEVKMGGEGAWTTIFAISANLAYARWVDQLATTLEIPVARAVRNREQWAANVSVTSISVSAVLAAAIPLLVLLISRRTQQIKWLTENLEDRAVVYALLGRIFGVRTQGHSWLSSDGPDILEEWLNHDPWADHDKASGLDAIRRGVRSNMDAVQFHRLLTSSGLKSGCLEERFEHSDDGVTTRYIVSIPQAD